MAVRGHEVSDCSTNAWKIVDGVYMRQHVIPQMLSIFWKDTEERPRDLMFDPAGREVDHIELNGKRWMEEPDADTDSVVINGERWVRAPKFEEKCEVLD